MKIQESQENYLESIYMLSLQRGDVRSIDIVHHLGFSKPSVSVAMKQLKDNGYIRMDEKGYISLLEKGRDIAQNIYDRHQILAKMLISGRLQNRARNQRREVFQHQGALSGAPIAQLLVFAQKGPFPWGFLTSCPPAIPCPRIHLWPKIG